MNLNIEKDVEIQMLKQVDRIMFILYPKNNEFDKTYDNIPLVIECNTSISNLDIILKIMNNLKTSLHSLFKSFSLAIYNFFN